jgi:hypothetical protein
VSDGQGSKQVDVGRHQEALHEKLLSVPSLVYRLGFALGVGIAMLPLIALHVLA